MGSFVSITPMHTFFGLNCTQKAKPPTSLPAELEEQLEKVKQVLKDFLPEEVDIYDEGFRQGALAMANYLAKVSSAQSQNFH
jgi:hypothetical protein